MTLPAPSARAVLLQLPVAVPGAWLAILNPGLPPGSAIPLRSRLLPFRLGPALSGPSP